MSITFTPGHQLTVNDLNQLAQQPQTGTQLPVGTITLWTNIPTEEIPPNWAICNGLMQEFKLPDGTRTSLNTPNLQGYTPVGANGTDEATQVQLGKTTGTTNVSVPLLEHNHTIANDTFKHSHTTNLNHSHSLDAGNSAGYNYTSLESGPSHKHLYTKPSGSKSNTSTNGSGNRITGSGQANTGGQIGNHYHYLHARSWGSTATGSSTTLTGIVTTQNKGTANVTLNVTQPSFGVHYIIYLGE